MEDLVESARSYAQKAHEGQTRKGKTVPYFSHVSQVGRTLSNYGFEDEVIAAGYLHDVTEDVEDVTLESIEDEFGPTVRRLVDGASEDDKSLSWKERKENTLEHLEDAPMDEVVVKVSDKIDNVRSMKQEEVAQGEKFWDKFNASYEKQVWYHTELTEIIGQKVEQDDYDLQGSVEEIYEELRHEVDQVFGTNCDVAVLSEDYGAFTDSDI